MKPHPRHVDGWVVEANDRFPDEADDFHHFFKIQCECGRELFRLFESNKRSVKATCASCGRETLVYDLSRYPAASKLSGVESFVPMSVDQGDSGLRVFVMYEYGEPDEDQKFDPDDISWCQVFVESKNGQIKKVFDDETA